LDLGAGRVDALMLHYMGGSQPPGPPGLGVALYTAPEGFEMSL
jgi:hypothetical protein